MQSIQRFAFSIGLAALVALALGACTKGQDKDTVAAERPTVTQPQQTNQPVDVNGCLKSGDAPDTFVVTTAATTGTGEAATYQLLGTDAAALRDHVGERVQVKGTLTSEQQVASQSTAQREQAKGTTGTPTVETRTEVQVKQLQVDAVHPTGVKCDR